MQPVSAAPAAMWSAGPRREPSPARRGLADISQIFAVGPRDRIGVDRRERLHRASRRPASFLSASGATTISTGTTAWPCLVKTTSSPASARLTNSVNCPFALVTATRVADPLSSRQSVSMDQCLVQITYYVRVDKLSITPTYFTKW